MNFVNWVGSDSGSILLRRFYFMCELRSSLLMGNGRLLGLNLFAVWL